jgi:HSP20 family protein
MTLVGFDPDLRRFERQMTRMFDDFFGDLGRQGVTTTGNSGGRTTTWSPRVEAYETDKEFVVNAELPGVPKEKVNIDIRDNNMIIGGEHAQSNEVNQGTVHYTERRYGSFTRAIPLPSNVNANEAKAKYDNGILTVQVPKNPEAQPKKITID